MDFHSLARKDLQALCKKNKIPANLTNVAMADALQALKSIEWDEEIRKKLMPQSETIELQHGSPLPRSRRVTALSNDNSGVPMQEIADKEEQTKEALIEAINQTPSTAVRRSTRIQSVMGTRTRARTSAVATGTATRTTASATGTATRTSTAASGKITSMAGTRIRGGKKEETSAAAVEVAAVTPAPQCGRKKAVETPAQVVDTPAQQRGRKKATETPAPAMVPRSSARPTRQSSRRPAESTKSTRVTRTMASMILDVNDGKEAQAVADKIEEKKDQTAVEVNGEKVDEVIELVEATKYDSTDKLEVQEEEEDQNQVTEVSEEIEPAKELSEFAEEKTQEESKSNAVTLISEEKDEMPAENAEEDVAEKLNSNLSFVVDSEIPTDKAEEEDQEMLNSEDTVVSLVCDEFKDDGSVEQPSEEVNEVGAVAYVEPIPDEIEEEEVNEVVCDEFKDDGSVEQPLEEVNEVGAVTNVEPIPDEVEKEEIEVSQTTLVDSPIMGLVSEVVPENTSDLQDALLSDVTVDAQDAPSDLCFSSPVRAPADVGLEKMLDSVVRHFAKASIKDSAKKTDACCLVQQEDTIQVVSNEPSGLVQNENAAKETVDLKNMSLRKLKALYKDSAKKTDACSLVQQEDTVQVVSNETSGLVQNENAAKQTVDLKNMSLRKLKALYKDRLIEINSKKAVEEGKRLPLGELDENLLV